MGLTDSSTQLPKVALIKPPMSCPKESDNSSEQSETTTERGMTARKL